MSASTRAVRVWTRQIVALTAKELIQLYRDPVLLGFMVFLFTASIYLQGANMSMQLRAAPLLVHDGDRSAASRELIYRFRPPYFHLSGEVESPREGRLLLDEGRAVAVLDIPSGFQKAMLAGQSTTLQLQVDATPTAQAFLAASYAARIVGEFSLETALVREGLGLDAEGVLPVIRNESRAWFNPNQKDSWFIPISELLEAITIMTILLPGAAMVREKQRGTVEQLLVAPLSPIQIMLPKVISMTVVILVGVSVTLFVIAGPIFDVPMRGSLPLFYTVTALYVFTNAGLGLFAATIARNVAQLGLLAIFMVVPLILLSGTWTPPEAMPRGMQIGTFFLPMRHYVDVSYGILFKGAGLSVLWDSVLIMGCLGGAVFGFGVWRFRRQFG